jgi:hypothetical protein
MFLSSDLHFVKKVCGMCCFDRRMAGYDEAEYFS